MLSKFIDITNNDIFANKAFDNVNQEEYIVTILIDKTVIP